MTAHRSEPDTAGGRLAVERFRRCLTELYTDGDSRWIVNELSPLFSSVTTTSSVRAGFGRRDVFLSAYPDHVHAEDSTPLQALGALLTEQLRDVVTGIHLLPFHPATSDGGFAVADFDAVDSAYGSEADVAALAEECRLMADAVVNHTSASHRWFQRFLAGQDGFRHLYREVEPTEDLSTITRPRATPAATRFQGGRGAVDVWTTFSADQVDLDYRHPRTFVLMAQVLARYVELGASVLRLDAAGYLWKLGGTASLHLPQTHALIRAFRAFLDVFAPSVLLVTETNVPHRENVAYLGDGTQREAQAVYDFTLPPLLLHALWSGDCTTLVASLEARVHPPPGTTVLNFISSHDGLGLWPATDELDGDGLRLLVDGARELGVPTTDRALPGGRTTPYEINSSWLGLMAFGVGADLALARHIAAHNIVLALRGVPLLYPQTLFAVDNDWARFGRTGVPRDLNRTRFRLESLAQELGDPISPAGKVMSDVRASVEVRRRYSAFGPTVGQDLSASSPEVLVVRRTPQAGVHVIVATNVTRQPRRIDLPADTVWASPEGQSPRATLELEPYASATVVETR